MTVGLYIPYIGLLDGLVSSKIFQQGLSRVGVVEGLSVRSMRAKSAYELDYTSSTLVIRIMAPVGSSHELGM